MKNRKPLFLLIPITIFFGTGFVTMLLWNFLIPSLFGLKSITYFQALGLFLLSRIIFGSFGFRNKKPPFANAKFRENMINMNDEERQKFKEEWKNRCKK
jgi:hypothetical protein